MLGVSTGIFWLLLEPLQCRRDETCDFVIPGIGSIDVQDSGVAMEAAVAEAGGSGRFGWVHGEAVRADVVVVAGARATSGRFEPCCFGHSVFLVYFFWCPARIVWE